MREFIPFYAGQPPIGVTGGLLVFAADESGLVEVAGGAAGVATVAFAVGFSEAAFVRPSGWRRSANNRRTRVRSSIFWWCRA